MATVLIVYGSTTGNTEFLAQGIAAILMNKYGHTVTVKDVAGTSVEDLGHGYDLTMLGSSTWGDDGIEFQEDFAPFYEDLHRADLKNKSVAIFGCGDSSYEHFCGAVDLLEEMMAQLGARVMGVPLRIDGDPAGAQADIQQWVDDIAQSL